MAARAMWKGVIRFGDVRVPVKLYSAIEDRDVHFRLLHRKDRQPVKQMMVNPETDEIVPHEETRRAFLTDEGDLVILDREDLDALEPEPSRDIEVLHFLPAHEVDHRWYDRPYWLGPDGADGNYFALAQGLANAGMEGLARWAMRRKEYVGALRVHEGYPMLMSLRRAEEVVSVEDLEAPKGKPLDERELSMARQLIGMLEADFEPAQYQDEFRERVLELLETKQQGGKVKRMTFRRREPVDDLSRALEASIRMERKHG